MLLGWIKLHRKMQDHWIMQDAEMFRAWVLVLLTVSYKVDKVLIKGNLIDCGIGQSVKSLDTWSKVFGNWSKSKTKRFLDLLKKDKMIQLENLKVTTRLTVCNYKDYQDVRNIDETQPKHSRYTDKKLKNKKKIYSVVLEYLNNKVKKNYKSTDKHKSLINSRINDGYTIDDFMKVIDIKAKEWLNTDLAKYLRPETLFGNKFDGYLNQEPIEKKPTYRIKE